MQRPTTLQKDGTINWVIPLYDASGFLIDADSLPSVTIRKNGSAIASSVSVTKRSATSGIYDCSYTPSSLSVGDQMTVEETVLVGGDTYFNAWSFVVTASINDLLTTQMTESYAANGVAPTLAQAVFAIHQALMDVSISGTSWTAYKLDSSTEAFVMTLNDATNPTGVERV